MEPELAKGTSYLLIDGREDRRHDRSLFFLFFVSFCLDRKASMAAYCGGDPRQNELLLLFLSVYPDMELTVHLTYVNVGRSTWF